MAEITLQQIADLLAAQEVRMDQKLAAMEERIDQKFTAQTVQVGEMVDQKFAEFKASQDASFKDVIDTIHALDRHVEEHIEKKMAELQENLTRDIPFLIEQREGRKIESVIETLDDHEKRIDKLEAAAG